MCLRFTARASSAARPASDFSSSNWRRPHAFHRYCFWNKLLLQHPEPTGFTSSTPRTARSQETFMANSLQALNQVVRANPALQEQLKAATNQQEYIQAA